MSDICRVLPIACGFVQELIRLIFFESHVHKSMNVAKHGESGDQVCQLFLAKSHYLTPYMKHRGDMVFPLDFGSMGGDWKKDCKLGRLAPSGAIRFDEAPGRRFGRKAKVLALGALWDGSFFFWHWHMKIQLGLFGDDVFFKEFKQILGSSVRFPLHQF